MSHAPVSPALEVLTRPLTGAPDLLSLTHPNTPLAWVKQGNGAVGFGELLRFSTAGVSRFTDAAAQWQRIAQHATVDDTVRRPGSGLRAFGTFAFADSSSAGSTMLIPRLLIARDGDHAWVTYFCERVAAGDDAIAAMLRNTVTVDETALTALLAAVAARFGIPTPPHPTPWQGTDFTPATSPAAHRGAVSEALRRIARGEAEKIVVARQISGRIASNADLRVPLRRLAREYTDCWTFAVDGLLGASPETLIRVAGGSATARVLAGTRTRHAESVARDAQARDELLGSSKEHHEHDFAVQSVVTALAPHVLELRASESPFALRLPNVWHLATDVTATLAEQSSALDFVAALHPTAAVAGTPTRAAVAAIAEIEGFDRGRYSGAVGWIDAAGDGEWVIALRCAVLGEDRGAFRSVTATAGGGIVSGADPAHEFTETESKFRPIVEAFGPEK